MGPRIENHWNGRDAQISEDSSMIQRFIAEFREDSESYHDVFVVVAVVV